MYQLTYYTANSPIDAVSTEYHRSLESAKEAACYQLHVDGTLGATAAMIWECEWVGDLLSICFHRNPLSYDIGDMLIGEWNDIVPEWREIITIPA